MRPIYDLLGVTVGDDPVGQNDDRQAARPTPPTSPTAPTPSSASTTCATTSPIALEEQGPARPPLRDRRRGRQHPDRRGAHAADHLRRARAGRRPLLQVRPARAARWSRARSPRASRPSRRTGCADFDYEPDEKHKTVALTERGVEKAEKFLGIDNLYLAEHGNLVNHLIQALKAESLYKRDIDYAVIDGEVKIIDEFTGRILEGRRWSEGLHQAVEAKEGVAIQEENQTRRDDHLPELLPHVRQARRHDRHGAHRGDRVHEDLQAPGGRDPDQPADGPRRPQRPDLQDQGRQVGRPSRARSRSATRRGQPVLVGTISVEVSELLSERAARSAASSTSC